MHPIQVALPMIATKPKQAKYGTLRKINGNIHPQHLRPAYHQATMTTATTAPQTHGQAIQVIVQIQQAARLYSAPQIASSNKLKDHLQLH